MNIPTGFAQINYVFTGVGLPNGAQCTLGVDLDEFAGTASTLASTMRINLEESQDLWDSTGTMVQLSECRVKLGPNATGAMASSPSTKAGSYSATDSLPSAAYLIRKNTSMGGRQGRGRLYWPGAVLQDCQDDGDLLTNLITEQDAGWSTFIGKVLADGLIPVLLRAEESPLQTPVTIESMTCQGRLATQRRRLRP